MRSGEQQEKERERDGGEQKAVHVEPEYFHI